MKVDDEAVRKMKMSPLKTEETGVTSGQGRGAVI